MNDSRIKCLSIPIESKSKETDKAAQISQWWERVEQSSIELALDYEIIIHTDVVDCYSSMYTHSIAWALHTKAVAKARRNDPSMIGNIIDKDIQDMRQGQTNGIPQGSVLMDFVAELILGYADTELLNRIDLEGVDNFQILRYRDDYRIYVNNSQDAKIILKCLTETMIELGLRLNPTKTTISNDVIVSSIKQDRLGWMFRRQADNNVRKHLLIINDHSINYPHSGSLVVALHKCHARISGMKKKKLKMAEAPLPLISIVTSIAFRNPRAYPICAAILSLLLDLLNSKDEKRDTVKRIIKKFSQIPNTGHLSIWLQRFTYKFDPGMTFDEPLCSLLLPGIGSVEVWNNDWISDATLKGAIDTTKIVDLKALGHMPTVITPKEVALFPKDYY